MMKKMGKILKDFLESIIIGTFISVILFYVVSLILIAGTGEKLITNMTAILLVINFLSVFGCILVKQSRMPHKYDADLIGYNFVGINKKCRIFKSSLEHLISGRLKEALSGFKSMEEAYGEALPESEQAVLDFYLGRCYEEIGFMPNACLYYEKAQKMGLKHGILPFLYARCLWELGDTDESLRIYKSVMNDSNNIFRIYVRTAVGRHYLKDNKAAKALEWYNKAIEIRENYGEALGGAAIARTMIHEFDKGEELYRMALLNGIDDSKEFTSFFKEIQAAALSESFNGNKEKNAE